MPLLTQKYFSDGDSLSSSDYNSNVSNWNSTTKVIDGSNIRDQGLDIPNFKNNSCTEVVYAHANSILKTIEWPEGSPTNGYHTVYNVNIPHLTWATIEPGAIWNDQPVYVFRQDLSWNFPMTGVQADISKRSWAEFEFHWFYSSDQITYPQIVTKKIRFSGRQLAMYRGDGNVSFSTILTPDMFNETAQTNVKIKCRVTFSQSSNADMVFTKGATFDSTVVWNDDYVKFHIEDYNVSVTKYFRAF